MEAGRPSATAHRAAMLRAAHQILEAPHVLEDPFALKIVGEAAAAAIPAAREQFDAPPARLLRAFLVARSRYAEDELAQSVARGVRQYVVLGAGLDTYALRSPHPGLRVFEIDHPATQAWKRGLLDAGGIAVPESLWFVPVDFETEDLVERLRSAGLKTDEPAFFSWLGVTMYLSPAVVLATMRQLLPLTRPEGGVVFDFAADPTNLSPEMQAGLKALAARVAAAGEPLKSVFDPASLVAELRAAGYARTRHVGQPELHERYFRDRTDNFALVYANLMDARP